MTISFLILMISLFALTYFRLPKTAAEPLFSQPKLQLAPQKIRLKENDRANRYV